MAASHTVPLCAYVWGRGLRLTAYRTSEETMEIVPAPGDREWMKQTPGHFADRCLPLRMANQAGWWLLNPIEFEACWRGMTDKGAIEIKGDAPLVFSHFGSGILTFSIPYLFRTEPGYNLLVRGPANLPKNAISPLEGLVETDWATSTFTMNWKFTEEQIPVTFLRDEPIAMIVPQPRGELEAWEPEIGEMSQDGEIARQYLAWAESRRTFNDDLQVHGSKAQREKWQKDYVISEHPGHQTKLRLKSFS